MSSLIGTSYLANTLALLLVSVCNKPYYFLRIVCLTFVEQLWNLHSINIILKQKDHICNEWFFQVPQLCYASCMWYEHNVLECMCRTTQISSWCG